MGRLGGHGLTTPQVHVVMPIDLTLQAVLFNLTQCNLISGWYAGRPFRFLVSGPRCPRRLKAPRPPRAPRHLDHFEHLERKTNSLFYKTSHFIMAFSFVGHRSYWLAVADHSLTIASVVVYPAWSLLLNRDKCGCAS